MSPGQAVVPILEIENYSLPRGRTGDGGGRGGGEGQEGGRGGWGQGNLPIFSAKKKSVCLYEEMGCLDPEHLKKNPNPDVGRPGFTESRASQYLGRLLCSGPRLEADETSPWQLSDSFTKAWAATTLLHRACIEMHLTCI